MESLNPWKHTILTLSLISLGLASFIPRSEALTHQLNARDGAAWPYGVIGDSWGSGVSYNTEVLYDGNRDGCLRTKESHGPQMEADQNWVGHNPSGLRDAACSGSVLFDIVKGQEQMGKVGDSPAVVVMTSGGNNAGFGHIVDVCIYHSDPTHNYGNPYWNDKDGSGDCAKALAEATEYINNPDKMPRQLTETLNDLFNHPASKNPDFLLYLTGYAQFFGTDYDPWCDFEYWSIPTINPFNYDPYLSKSLRQAFNDRVSAVNKLYKSTAESDKFKDKVRFVDIDSHFSGHRFCEPGSNYKEQVNTDTHFDKVYLWNLNYSWQVTGKGAPSAAAAEGNVTAAEAQAAFAGGGGVTAWSGSGSGAGGNKPENGWRLRPFHPRYTGYTAIKEAIIDQLKKDGLPKAGESSKTVKCYHAADPRNTCAAIANGSGWCDCGDDKKYINKPGSKGGDICAWTTLPATTSFDCGGKTAAPTPPPTPPKPDLDSPECKECMSNLGASDCGPKELQCLVDQCKGDKNCQACKMDCESVGKP